MCGNIIKIIYQSYAKPEHSHLLFAGSLNNNLVFLIEKKIDIVFKHSTGAQFYVYVISSKTSFGTSLAC